MIACGGTENIVMAGNVLRVSSSVEILPQVGRHEGDITSLSFLNLGSNQDSDLVSGSGDATCSVWDLEKSTFKSRFTHHTADVLTVGTEKDAHRVLSGSADTTTRLWDTRDSKTDGIIFTGAQSDVKSVCFSPNSTMCAVASADGVVRVYDIRRATNKTLVDGSSDVEKDPALVYDTDQKTKKREGPPIHLPGDERGLNEVKFSEDGRWLYTAHEHKDWRIYDALTGFFVKVVNGHEDTVSCLSVRGNKVCTGSWDKVMQIWDMSYPMYLPSRTLMHEFLRNSTFFNPTSFLLNCKLGIGKGNLTSVNNIQDYGSPCTQTYKHKFLQFVQHATLALCLSLAEQRTESSPVPQHHCR
jgi:WD40 repeat protein